MIAARLELYQFIDIPGVMDPKVKRVWFRHYQVWCTEKLNIELVDLENLYTEPQGLAFPQIGFERPVGDFQRVPACGRRSWDDHGKKHRSDLVSLKSKFSRRNQYPPTGRESELWSAAPLNRRLV
ncbi:MAG: hypothetical protein WD314_09355 [Trueperaceae bacterium]